MTSPISLPSLAQSAVETNSSCCSCDWKSIAGIVAAVVGVVASIFVESIFGVIGFALFGAVLLIKCYENSQRASEIEVELTNTLAAKEKEMAAATEQMKTQLQTVESERDKFTKDVQQLTQANKKLQEIETSLTTDESRLEKDNQALGKEKSELQQSLDAGKANALAIRAQVREITDQNLKFGTTTGLFEHNVEALSGIKQQLEEQLTSFDHEFDGDVGKLLEQIQVAKNASKTLVDSAAERSKVLEADLKALKSDVDQRHQLEQTLQTSIADLEVQRQKITEQTTELTQKQQTLLQTEQEIEQKRKLFEEEIVKTRAEMDQSREEFEETKRKETDEHLKSLEELKEQEKIFLDAIKEKIAAKKEELRKLKEEVAQAKSTQQ